MFYTKYRPQKFSEISKPNDVAEALSKQIAGGKAVHAYLFIGSRGTGKTTTARILAKALNCEHLEKDGDPCGKCPTCKSIAEGSFTDMIEIDAASNRGIDDIRELKDKIKLAPSMGKHKVYIIDEVHMLTSEAFNALLKTLEEPPRNTTFILCTTESHKVPDTIKSRCQVFKFKRAGVSQLVSKLKEIGKEEKIKLDDEDYQKIALASLGGFRDAETLLEQVAEGDISVDSLLGMNSRDVYIDFVSDLASGDAAAALTLLNKVFEDGLDLYTWTGELLRYMRDLLFVKSGVPNAVSGVTPELLTKITSQAEVLNISWINSAVEILLEAHSKIKSSFITQLPLEVAVLKITGLSDSDVSKFSKPKGTEPKPKVDQEKTSKPKEKIVVEDAPEELLEVILETENEVETSEDAADEKHVDSEATGDAAVISVEEVEEKWKDFLKQSKDLNHSLTALLKSVKVVGVEGRIILLEVSYKFHKERLEAPSNRTLVESLLNQIYGQTLGVKCVLCKEPPKRVRAGETGNLTDMNVAPAQAAFNRNAVIDAFDGGLPLI